jgi:tryptophan synthase alpha chain
VGFGISTPSQANEIGKYADGVIIGSAIVKIIENNVGRSDLVKKVGAFVKSIANNI